MKKIPIVLCTICAILLYACLSKGPAQFDEVTRTSIENRIDTIAGILKKVEEANNTDTAKRMFSAARKSYKIIEPFIEYYYQGLSRRINGPALPEVKTDDNMVNDPAGFQVLEELIYADSTDFAELAKQARILTTDLLFVKKTIADLPIQDHHFYELMQHQVIRIATLGITGFDSPVAFQSIEEASWSLQGLRQWYESYCEAKGKEPSRALIKQVGDAIAYTGQNSDFDAFNRLRFIKNHLMPLSRMLEDDFRTVIAATPGFEKNKAFFGHLENLMQGKRLNPDAFSPFAESATTPQKVALGKLLFNDVTLSKNKNLSCASCHNENKAFTDGKVTSVTNVHNNSVNRNSPTLLYSGFQKSFFYDLRSQDLENQIESVMKNPDEFDLSPEQINKRVLSNPVLAGYFTKAYPDKKQLTAFEIRNAIAAYVRSLMPFNSRVDQYFKGQGTLTESEVNGFNLFAGKAKCATCHFIPVYNGTVPPWFNNTESEVIGVPQTSNWKQAVVDADVGRYSLNSLEPLKFSFKTPTVRNSAKTAPYMHNGVYNTLDEVIRFYELGGGNGIGMKLDYQTLPFENLQLTAKEKQDIANFLKALTDENHHN
jgi:cytochrome c peroxidase